MQPAIEPCAKPLDDTARHAALRAVLRLLDHWQCSEREKTALLGVGRSTLHKYQSRPESARVSNDLLERLSYLLNIHQALRTCSATGKTSTASCACRTTTRFSTAPAPWM